MCGSLLELQGRHRLWCSIFLSLRCLGKDWLDCVCSLPYLRSKLSRSALSALPAAQEHALRPVRMWKDIADLSTSPKISSYDVLHLPTAAHLIVLSFLSGWPCRDHEHVDESFKWKYTCGLLASRCWALWSTAGL